MSNPVIRQAKGASDVGAVGAMIREYADAFGFAPCYDGLDKELADLPGVYGPPFGRLLIAEVDREPAGCVALRPLEGGACEMKRLFVRPGFRGHGLGRLCCLAILAEAEALGYRTLRLDTWCDMTEAKRLYRALGFVSIPAYYPGAEDGVEFFERSLTSGAPAL